jgi:hypothetical protein
MVEFELNFDKGIKAGKKQMLKWLEKEITGRIVDCERDNLTCELPKGAGTNEAKYPLDMDCAKFETCTACLLNDLLLAAKKEASKEAEE